MDTPPIKLQEELEKAIFDLGFSEFTEIQEKAIPLIQQGHDVIGQSHTGSGKTAAFGFPALEKVTRGHGIQLLVILPTRELCNQIAKEMNKFSKYKPVKIVEVYGGVSIIPQIDSLKHADVVISTPGRLLDHINRKTINLSKIKILVLDEADKMFEMGFVDDIKRIIAYTPKERQTLLFSATMSHDVLAIIHHYTRNPMKVKMQTYVDKSQLIQHYYNIPSQDKFSLLVHILKQEMSGLTIIFCATRRRVDDINNNLRKQGLKTQALHGGLSQNKRKQVMDAFHGHKLDVLIASDVAARGLDIKDVGLVVNYDLPKVSQEYVNRIGRTARAGSKGKVVSLLAPEDHDNFRRVLQDRSLLVHKIDTPSFERVPFIRRAHHPQEGRFNQSRGGFNQGRNRNRRRSFRKRF